MASNRRIVAAVLICGLLSACQGSGSSGSSATPSAPTGGAGSSSGGSANTAPAQTFATGPAQTSMILVPAGTHSLQIYLRDPWTGALIDRGYVPTGQQPDAVATSGAKYVYVANYQSGTVSAYGWNMNSNQLTPLNSGNNAVSSGAGTASLAIVGSTLYALNTGNDDITAFTIASDGTLTAAGSTAATGAPASLVAGPNILYALASNGITSYSTGSSLTATGNTTPVSGLIAGTTDSAGHLYVLTQGTVTVFTPGSGGALTQTGQATLPSGLAPVGLAVAGDTLSVTGDDSGEMETAFFTIGNGTVSASAAPPTTTTGTAEGISASPAGHYVFVTNSSRDDLFAYSIPQNGSPGVMSSVLRTRLSPQAPFCLPVTVTMQSPSLYVVDQSTTAIAAYPAQQNGLLGTPVISTTCNACTTNIADQGPSAAAIAPDGLNLYASDWAQGGPGDVTSFPMATPNGSLGSPNSLAAGQSPMGVALDPSDRYLYVANSCYDNTTGSNCPGTIDGYDLNQGAPTAFSSGFTTGTYGDYPMLLAADPTGRFLYSAEFAGDMVDAFAIDPDTGALSFVTGSGATSSFGTGVGPWTIVIGPSGRHLYVSDNGNGASQTNGTVSVFSIDAQNGTLSADPNLATSNIQPLGLVMGPKGRRLYVATQTGALDVFVRQDPLSANGAWNPTPTVIPGNFTNAYGLALSDNGKTLYVLDNCTAPNYNNGSIQALAVPAFSQMASTAYTTLAQYPTNACTVQAVPAGGLD